MPDLFITRHAIKRYRERVAALPAPAIWRALDCRAVRVAISFGAPFVKLAGGQRIVLRDSHVVTVLPPDIHFNNLRTERDHLHGSGD